MATSANAIVASLFTFSGGCQTPTMAVQPGDYTSQAIPPINYQTMVPFFQPAGVETLGPGLGYQSAKAGVPACFFWAPGAGSMSARALHGSFMEDLRHGLYWAVKLIRAAGYEPTIHFIINQGHADADGLDDGGNPGTPTSQADYTLAWRKNIATMRLAATQALGIPFTGPIWVTPMLTQNGVQSYAARNAIVSAQVNMPNTIAGVRLLPSYGQFANLFDVDLEHPLGPGYRYKGELDAAFTSSGLTVPQIVSKAVVSPGVVAVTFNQPVQYGSVPDATARGTSCDGFNVVDNTGAEVQVNSTSVSGAVVTLNVASTANCTGSWLVRNGLQQLSPIGNTGVSAAVMPRTRMVGMIDAGTAQDGTPLQNTSIPQEFSA